MLLEKIKSPADVKALDIKSLEQLAAEMRTALLKKLSKRGGHVAPNLGFVEGTIALHYVFDSPKDKRAIRATATKCSRAAPRRSWKNRITAM